MQKNLRPGRNKIPTNLCKSQLQRFHTPVTPPRRALLELIKVCAVCVGQVFPTSVRLSLDFLDMTSATAGQRLGNITSSWEHLLWDVPPCKCPQDEGMFRSPWRRSSLLPKFLMNKYIKKLKPGTKFGINSSLFIMSSEIEFMGKKWFSWYKWDSTFLTHSWNWTCTFANLQINFQQVDNNDEWIDDVRIGESKLKLP